jgi:flagellar protein FlaG
MAETAGAIKSVSSKAPTAALTSPYSDNNNRLNIVAKPVEKTDDSHDEQKKSSRESVERTVRALEDYIESSKRSLKMEVHENTGDIIVKVISVKDGKVIREIPSEQMLDLASKMEELAGSLFNETA